MLDLQLKHFFAVLLTHLVTQPQRVLVNPSSFYAATLLALKGAKRKQLTHMVLFRLVRFNKFCETGWRWVLYLCAHLGGLYCLHDKPWVWNTAHCWHGYPYHPIGNLGKEKNYVTTKIKLFQDVGSYCKCKQQKSSLYKTYIPKIYSKLLHPSMFYKTTTMSNMFVA